MFKQYILSPLCLKCGSFFTNESLFCEICFADEISSRLQSESFSHIPEHIYLLEWHKYESDILSEMVYRLKSDNSPQAWDFYSGLLYQKLKENIDLKNYEALVPIPGSKQSSVHSLLLARGLSDRTDLKIMDILKKETEGEQKKLTAAQRKKHNSRVSLKSPSPEHFTKVIFVDDVLTTGASFFQCQQALQGGPENLVLTLFYRPKAQ